MFEKKKTNNRCWSVSTILFFLDDIHAEGTDDEKDASEDEHQDFGSELSWMSEGTENQSTQGGRDNLRNANGAVEESEISTHMSTLQGVGEDGEWEC